MKDKLEFLTTLAIMTLAVLAVVIPLTIFHNVFLTFILYYGAICLLIPFVDLMLAKKMSFRDFLRYIGFKGIGVRPAVLFGLGHGFVIYLLTIGVFFFFRDRMLAGNDVITAIRDWGVSGRETILLTGIMLLFNGIVEEIFWRGYAFEKLKRAIGPSQNPWPTIVISASFYTSYHLATILTFFHLTSVSGLLILSVFTAGLGWGWLKSYYNNLWVTAIGHFLATAGYMTVFSWLV